MERIPDPCRIIQAIPDPMVVLNAQGMILYANQAFSSLFPEPSGNDLRGRSIFTVTAGLSAEGCIQSLLEQVWKTGHAESRLPPIGARYGKATGSLLVGGERAALLMLHEYADSREAEEMVSCRDRQVQIISRIIAAATSSMTLDEILSTSLEETLTMLDFDAGAVYLINTATGMADLKAFSGIHNLYFTGVQVLDPAEPLIRDVLVDGKAQYFEQYMDVDHDHGEDGIFSLAKVPITIGDDVLGVICIASSNRYRFSPLEKEILEAIGRKIGGAVRRGLLQDQIHEKHSALIGYITETTNRVIIPAELLQGNLIAIRQRFADIPDLPDDLLTELCIQIRIAEQILRNLHDLNTAIVEERTEIPSIFRDFLLREGHAG
ncbi:GAF domain-containing protein [Methanoculleus sp. FWC-SCC1]|uniref:GAF domain-containing protein n=1 Tax=Methanoculleus frigidifontis TaxID=2584085 RepID=A0ABT8MAF8_9EURY|nr:GAF domain-containing protein [Methanoculleus sp. FWC-SCC1]MDN7024918.1 GAF domain-containing protein [Methanoculleus sp. FWC-SCC1]